MEQEISMMLEAINKSGLNLKQHAEHFRDENIAFLQANFPDENLSGFFAACSFDEGIQIGNLWYDQANSFNKEFAWEEQFASCVVSQLLPVGSGLNGDPIVLDVRDLKIGFLFHDIFWGKDNVDPRTCLVKMNCSIGQFYLNAATIDNYPVDAYDAQDYVSTRFDS